MAHHDSIDENSKPSADIPPKKIGTAWKRLCATFEEFGRQKDRNLLVMVCSENRLLVRANGNGCHLTLTLLQASVAREMGEVRDSIVFVSIRQNGVAYQWGGAFYTATRLVLELLKQYPSYSSPPVEETAPAPEAPTLSPPRKQATPEQIVRALRQLTLKMAAGASLTDSCNELGIPETVFRRWHREYSGLDLRHAKRLTKLEKENQELKRKVTELSLLSKSLSETSIYVAAHATESTQ